MKEWPYWECPKQDEPDHVCDGYCLPRDYKDRWREIKKRRYESLRVEYVDLISPNNALLRWVKKNKAKEKKP